MSIGRRLIDLARAELNSLLERAGREHEDGGRDGGGDGGGGHDGKDGWSGGLDTLSDAELEAELERRRRAREEAESAARGPRPAPGAGQARRPPRPDLPRRTAAGDDAIRKAYAALEVPPGSDFDTVRKSYRRLMRRYHPDLHAGSPDKQRDANARTQLLTDAYKVLDKHLRR